MYLVDSRYNVCLSLVFVYILCECCGIFISLTAIGDSFDKYMAEFNVLLIASLQNIAVHQVGMVKSDHYIYPVDCVHLYVCIYIHYNIIYRKSRIFRV